MAWRQLNRSNTIGFIGLGAMGNHMLNNLIKKHPMITPGQAPSFVVYDVNGHTMHDIVARHKIEDPRTTLRAAQSPKEVATHASIIISMVPTSKHSQDVYLGHNGVMSALEEMDARAISDTLCLDQSTIEQDASKSIALALRRMGAEMMDAPVSGGVVGAKDGTLAIMAGGSETAFNRALSVLTPMAKKVTHCGDLGAGLAAKIANNMLLGITMIGLSEAMLLGKNLGLSSQVLADIINSSTGRCWSSEINNPVPSVHVSTAPYASPAHRSYIGGFLTKLAHKDLALAVAAAETSDTPLLLGKLAEQMYRPLALQEEWGVKDFSVIYQWLVESRHDSGRESREN